MCMAGAQFGRERDGGTTENDVVVITTVAYVSSSSESEYAQGEFAAALNTDQKFSIISSEDVPLDIDAVIDSIKGTTTDLVVIETPLLDSRTNEIKFIAQLRLHGVKTPIGINTQDDITIESEEMLRQIGVQYIFQDNLKTGAMDVIDLTQ